MFKKEFSCLTETCPWNHTHKWKNWGFCIQIVVAAEPLFSPAALTSHIVSGHWKLVLESVLLFLQVNCWHLYSWAEKFKPWVLRFPKSTHLLFLGHVWKSSSSSTLFIHSQIIKFKSHFACWCGASTVCVRCRNPRQAAAFEELAHTGPSTWKLENHKLTVASTLLMWASCYSADESTASHADSSSLHSLSLVFSVVFTLGRLCSLSHQRETLRLFSDTLIFFCFVTEQNPAERPVRAQSAPCFSV